VASVVFSYLINYGLQWMIGERTGMSGRFVQPERLIESPGDVIWNILRDYWMVYGGKRAVYGYRYVTLPVLLLLGMIALAARARHHGRAATALVVLYMLGMTLIPFAIHPISGGRLPHRTLVSIPYVFWFFAAALVFSHIGWLRRVGIVLVVIVCIQCLHTFSSLQAQKRLVLDHDRALASQIYQRIVAEIPDFDRRKKYPLELYGPHEFRSLYRETGSTWSASFFEWDNGNPGRIVQFMTILGYSNFTRIDKATRESVLPALRQMPIWPAAGSVRVVDGIILIHLGERPSDVRPQAAEEP
jgi:hypothetical protein